jgi:hypothetical protein
MQGQGGAPGVARTLTCAPLVLHQRLWRSFEVAARPSPLYLHLLFHFAYRHSLASLGGRKSSALFQSFVIVTTYTKLLASTYTPTSHYHGAATEVWRLTLLSKYCSAQ